jgi:tight adherence protein C
VSAVVAAMGAVGLVLLVTGVPSGRRGRLRRRVEPYLGGLHGRPSSLLAAPSKSTPLSRWAQRLWQRLSPTSEERIMERLRAAGGDGDAGSFRLEQVTWGVGAALGVWALVLSGMAAGLELERGALPVLTASFFASGLLARDWWLSRQIESRRRAMQEELPTAIDLVTLAIMSGESVPAAFARVAGSIGTGIGSEFRKVVADVRAGAPVVEALEEMQRRVPVPGVGRFVNALCTAIERGAPLVDVLRAQAEDGRDMRRRYLLEAGGRREVLMLVPVVFLILPVVVVFALYPGLVALDLLVP